ncbi:diguanylate cyclase [Clostridium sartagoforme]|uniref:Diguanylate cyclase n=1 Tax=Clostridium sartagoforme TaxID=84031 RepID=A0A4S2DN11_9CLOT|nr:MULTISPECIES: diguanylate cyclase [Clostridium]MBS5937976.1 diguanylate cyclase [Clostridium sp.]TGY42414.1 diguanylate cyclase [Clostridium sartagoforme]
MNKRNLEGFEKAYLALITLIIIQIFMIFVNIYTTQKFSIESFTVTVIELISILLSYFLGIIPAIIFSIVYIVGYVFYVVSGEGSITLVSYILMFFIPVVTIYAGNMNKTRKRVVNDLEKLNRLEKIQLRIDENTSFENEFAFKEVLSKNIHLANRYESYYFSMIMFRLEFVETLRRLLDVKEFNNLQEKIAAVVQKCIREEDYKFIVSEGRIVLITPLTSSKSIAPAVRRILEGVGQLKIKSRDGDIVNVVLKAGTLDYSEDKKEVFKDYKSVLLELQKSTEVDIYGEYSD